MGRIGVTRRLGLLLALSAVAPLACAPEGARDDQPMVVPEAAKEAPVVVAPKPARPGDLVVYTIAHGGSILDVANLYKIHHHEIIRLNPGVAPEAALPVGSEVVVYQNDQERSQSVGLPHDGGLVGGMPMPDGPGRHITALRWKTWATRSTVMELDGVLRRWARQKQPDVLVSNLSARHGGPLSPHKTHQSGRDVDLGYLTKRDADEWHHVTPSTLDAEKTWKLLKLLVDGGNVEVVFMDRSLQRALLDHALAHGTIERGRLAHWLEVAKGARRGGPIVKHVPGHSDHFHVRFACRTSEPECRS